LSPKQDVTLRVSHGPAMALTLYTLSLVYQKDFFILFKWLCSKYLRIAMRISTEHPPTGFQRAAARRRIVVSHYVISTYIHLPLGGRSRSSHNPLYTKGLWDMIRLRVYPRWGVPGRIPPPSYFLIPPIVQSQSRGWHSIYK